MQTRFWSSKPVVLLIIAGLSFASWLAVDVSGQPSPPLLPSELPEPVAAEFHVGPDSTLLAGLQPGMSRAAVERMLTPFPTGTFEPVDCSADSVVIRSSYHVHLTEPVSNLQPSDPAKPFRPGLHLVTVEFDGKVRDHPMIRAIVAPAEPF